jgi:hypothetical protein
VRRDRAGLGIPTPRWTTGRGRAGGTRRRGSACEIALASASACQRGQHLVYPQLVIPRGSAGSPFLSAETRGGPACPPLLSRRRRRHLRLAGCRELGADTVLAVPSEVCVEDQLAIRRRPARRPPGVGPPAHDGREPPRRPGRPTAAGFGAGAARLAGMCPRPAPPGWERAAVGWLAHLCRRLPRLPGAWPRRPKALARLAAAARRGRPEGLPAGAVDRVARPRPSCRHPRLRGDPWPRWRLQVRLLAAGERGPVDAGPARVPLLPRL